jgi:hypothetical protein
MFKRELLKKKYQEMKGCTLLINPVPELRKAYLNMNRDIDSLTRLFNMYQLPNKLHEFDDTAMSIYVPSFHQDGKTYMLSECFSINIDCNMLKKEGTTQEQFENIIDIVVEKLSVEVLDYIQFNLTPAHVCQLLGIDEYVKNYGKFSLKDFILYATGSQKKFCEKLNISKSFLSEMVSGKQEISLNMLKKMHKIYPLFPVEVFF